MRITAISNSRIPSLTANSIQAMKVCDALAEAGHQVRLLAPAEAAPADWAQLASVYGLHHRFEVTWLSSRAAMRRLDFVLLARAAARRAEAELVYTWLPQAAAVEAWAGGSVLLEMHADVGGRLGAWWLRQLWRSQHSRLLVTTKALWSALEGSTRMKFPENRVQVAPNGVDLERYKNVPPSSEARARLGLPEGYTVGFSGHFYPGRGTELLLGLARDLPQLRFLLVGGTEDATRTLRQAISDMSLGNITVTGFVENSRLPLYQAAADVLLMPYATSISSSSGQDIAEVINPMKMFEYMAARRPILTADLPVIREVLDKDTAVFCEPGNRHAWVQEILALAGDEARASRLVESAWSKVQEFTWQRRAKRALEGMPL